ncbi:LysR family transcriptional regulator [Catenuloplanes sp. NPDC051500]|uniref:LysR family transcriptional regulator n=1 Tax=Catenuloplanes sp. NPDC051500 TaxID=3363959 RepID=UPI0037B2048C
MPELRQLQVLVLTADELNFTRAAARLFMTQQAVSKVIRQLEQEIGVALLERSTHTVRLTAAGESLVQDARQLLLLAASAVDRAREIGDGRVGTVRVGVSPALGPNEREAVVLALRGDTSGLSVELSELRPGKAAEALLAREIELAVVRFVPDLPSLEHAELRTAPARLYVPVGHRLAARTTPVTLEELDGERLLTWNAPGTPLTDLIVGRIRAAGADVRPTLSPTSGMALALSDLPDLGAVAIAPEGWQRTGRIVDLPLADAFHLPLFVIWASAAPSSAVQRLRAALSPRD